MQYLSSPKIEFAYLVSKAFLKDVKNQLLVGSLDAAEAAVLAYSLLAFRETQLVNEWINIFSINYPWFSDFTVIEATALLRAGDSVADSASRARALLIKAMKQGIPIYSAGVRLLFDGLRLYRDYANENKLVDKEIEQHLLKATSYASAADWRRHTTTYYGEDPNSPSQNIKLGIPEDDEHLVR